MDTGVKRCPRCQKSKTLESFGSNRAEKDGKNRYCKPCANAKGRESKARQTPKQKARNAERERLRRSTNREADLKRKREYREKNKAKIAEHQKKYRIKNAELFNEHKRKRRALERDALYLGHTAEDLKMKLDYYGGKCWICRTAEHEHWDHVKPVSKGGAHILANLRPSCASCNIAKNNKWPFSP